MPLFSFPFPPRSFVPSNANCYYHGSVANPSAFKIAAATSKLKFFSLDKRLKPLDQLLFRQFLALPMLYHPIDFLRRDDDGADNLNDTISGDAIFNDDLCEGIDFDIDISTKASDVHAQVFLGKESWEIKL